MHGIHHSPTFSIDAGLILQRWECHPTSSCSHAICVCDASGSSPLHDHASPQLVVWSRETQFAPSLKFDILLAGAFKRLRWLEPSTYFAIPPHGRSASDTIGTGMNQNILDGSNS
jgi:hypothetical protein